MRSLIVNTVSELPTLRTDDESETLLGEDERPPDASPPDELLSFEDEKTPLLGLTPLLVG